MCSVLSTAGCRYVIASVLQAVSLMDHHQTIGLAKKFVRVFLQKLTEKSEETFLANQSIFSSPCIPRDILNAPGQISFFFF